MFFEPPGHAGDRQFHLPINLIVAGTTSARTIVASIRIAKARPSPICFNITTDERPNALNTTTIIAAAPVISLPVLCNPFATAKVLSPVLSHSSCTLESF